MKKYEMPEIETVMLAVEDVITTSTPSGDPDETPIG